MLLFVGVKQNFIVVATFSQNNNVKTLQKVVIGFKYWSKMDVHFLHKTIRQSSNLQQVVCGTWLQYNKTPTPKQSIFVYQNHFVVYLVSPEKPDFSRPYYLQKFFGKVSYVCLGPKFRDLDSFFAAYNSFIILYSYDDKERFFTSKLKINLDKILIRPNLLYYNFMTSELVVSCNHGGMGKYSISFCGSDDSSQTTSNLIFSEKSTGAVLSSFISHDKVLVRIEGGYYFKMYDLMTMMTITNIPLIDPNMRDTVMLALPYNNGAAFIYGSGNILYASDEFPLSKIETIDFLKNPIDSPIIDWCEYDESSVLLLTMKSKLYIMNDRWQFLPFKDFQVPLNKNFIRIIQYAPKQILMISTGNKSYICCGQYIGRFETAVGQRGLATTRYDETHIPSFITYGNTEVTLNRVGVQGQSFIKRQLPIDGITGMYTVPLSKNPKDICGYIVFSCRTRSSLFYYFKSPQQSIVFQLAGPSSMNDPQMSGGTQYIQRDFIENAPTIGFGVISSDKDSFIQATPEGLNIFSSERKNFTSISNCKLFTSTARQILVFGNDGKYYEFTAEGLKPNNFPVEGDPRFAAFSTDVNSKQESCYFSVVLAKKVNGEQTRDFISVYKCENFDHLNHADIPMLYQVSSMCWALHNKIIVGLENGSVVILRFDPLSMSITAANNYSLGRGPVSVVNVFSAPGTDVVITYNTRAAKITLRNEALTVTPIFTVRYCYVAKLAFRLYAAISGKLFYVYPVNSLETELTTFQIQAKIELLQKVQPQLQGMQGMQGMPVPLPTDLPDNRNYTVVNVEYVNTSKDRSDQKTVYITTKSNIFVESPDYFAGGADNATLFTVAPSEVIVASVFIRGQNDTIIALVHDLSQEPRRCFARVIRLDKSSITETLIDKMYTHIAVSGNSIFMAAGTTLALYMLTPEMKLSCYSRIDNVGTNIVCLKASFYAIIGDENCGMMMYKINEKFQLECVFKEQMHRSITSLFCTGKIMAITGDRAGNVSIYQSRKESKVLMNMVLNFNAGAPITGCSIFNCPGQPIMLYTTITGEVGSFILCREFRNFQIQSSNLYLLAAIIKKISAVLLQLTKIDIFESMNQMIPMTSVLDLDIASIYAQLSNDKRTFIFNELKKDELNREKEKEKERMRSMSSDFDASRAIDAYRDKFNKLPDDFTTADVMFKDMITQMKMFFLR